MEANKFSFYRDYWTGDSRDGRLENGEGYHYYCMTSAGLIKEAYELYERDDGTEVASPLPELNNINWQLDLGFKDFEDLENISEREFERIKELVKQQ